MSLFPVYSQRGISLERGSGALVWDTDAKEYIDCVGGIAVASVGHANSVVAEAISVQAQRIIAVPGAFGSPVRDAFVEKLVSIAPEGLDQVFLCNSGAEAIEAAIKFARFSTGRTRIISAVRSYHGRTLGALSATHSPAYREPFMPLVEGFEHVPFDDLVKLEVALDGDTAAVLLEPIQGEGGVRIPSDGYLQGVRELCDRHGVLLIFDEVQTGFCRTGTMFRCEAVGVTPDMLCLAKAMAGGVPMGAVVVRDGIEAPTGRHGSTFGGNPLACAAGLAAITYMEEHDLASEAKRKGSIIVERLRAMDSSKVREVRGAGLLIAIDMREKSRPYIETLAKRGVLVMPTGPSIIRLVPPLVITEDQIERVLAAIEEVLA